jgi:hypothetical protein
VFGGVCALLSASTVTERVKLCYALFVYIAYIHAHAHTHAHHTHTQTNTQTHTHTHTHTRSSHTHKHTNAQTYTNTCTRIKAHAHRSICGPETDVYSYGVVVWELLTRRQPFGAATAYTLRADVAPGHVCLDTPKDGAPYLHRLFKCCTQFDPKQRPLLKSVLATLTAVGENPAEAEAAFPVPASESEHERLYQQLARQQSVQSGLGQLPPHLQALARECLSYAAALSIQQRKHQLRTNSGALFSPNPAVHQQGFALVTAAAPLSHSHAPHTHEPNAPSS